MNLKHISKWINQNDMEGVLCNEKIKSWLLEQGPITERIKSKHKFDMPTSLRQNVFWQGDGKGKREERM